MSRAAKVLASGLVESCVGALLFDFVAWLEQNAEEGPLLYVSREGFWLKQYHAALAPSTRVRPCYFLLSRAGLARLALVDPRVAASLYQPPYAGTIASLLSRRFAVSIAELVQADSLRQFEMDLFDRPAEDNDAFWAAREIVIERLGVRLNRERDLLSKRIKAMDERPNVQIADLGYSGTIPYLLENLIGVDVHAFYLVRTPSRRDGHIESRWGTVSWGRGTSLLDDSIVLESLLQAPHGQFIRVDEGETACRFVLKNDVMNEADWVELAAFHARVLASADPARALSFEDAEHIMSLLVAALRSATPDQLQALSAHDDWMAESDRPLTRYSRVPRS